MSTLAYAALTRKRYEAPADTSASTSPPGVKTYADAMAALVPAEVLVIHALVVQEATETTRVADRAVTTITDPTAMQWMFYAGIGMSMFLYVTGRLLTTRSRSRSRWQWLDCLRVLIPPAAFVLWTILLKSTAFDAIAPASLTEAQRILIGLVGAVILGGIASANGIYLSKQDPPARGEQNPPADRRLPGFRRSYASRRSHHRHHI